MNGLALLLIVLIGLALAAVLFIVYERSLISRIKEADVLDQVADSPSPSTIVPSNPISFAPIPPEKPAKDRELAQGPNLALDDLARESLAKSAAEAPDTSVVPTETPSPESKSESMPPVLPGGQPDKQTELSRKAEDRASDEVQFSAYRPEQVAVGQWYTLLVYAHLASALDMVRTDADRFRAQMGGVAKEVRGKQSAHIERGTELRIVPTCEGVIFNPEAVSFKWLETLHRAEFRFQADQSLAGTEDSAAIEIFVGPVLISRFKVSLRFVTPEEMPASAESQPITARLYREDQIFLSYSHTDSKIVLACRDAYKRLGFKPLIDVDTLRTGEIWDDRLKEMIEAADIFQLFWSASAAKSPYVDREWRHALNVGKTKAPGFIRPSYWEKPPAPIPTELEHLHFDFTPVAAVTSASTHPTSVENR